MDIEGIKKAKYKFNKHNNVIEKDGHTMFLEDVEKDLNRKSYLEEENKELKTENERLKTFKSMYWEQIAYVNHLRDFEQENTKIKERIKEVLIKVKELKAENERLKCRHKIDDVVRASDGFLKCNKCGEHPLIIK